MGSVSLFLPLAGEERTSGVWAINIQTGQIHGWMKFEDAVQEIFAVRVVPDAYRKNN